MIEAFGKNILTQLVKEEAPQKGVLLLPSMQGDYILSKIVSVGSQVKDVQAGYFVFTSKHAHEVITHEGQEFLSIRDDHILAYKKENNTNG